MKSEELGKIVSEMIDEALTNNEEAVINALTRGLSDADYIDHATLRVIYNSVRLSSILAVQQILAGLDSLGYIELRDKPLPNLRVLNPEEGE